jgi:hypothetical protein
MFCSNYEKGLFLGAEEKTIKIYLNRKNPYQLVGKG